MAKKNTYLTLLKISSELNTIHDSAQVLERIMDLAMESLGAERGFILLKHTHNGQPYNPVVARNLSKENITMMRNLSTSVVNRVLQTGRSILSVDALHDQRFGSSDSVVVQQIKSIMCVPLQTGDDILGAIYMDSRISSRVFDEDSLRFLEAFAEQASLSILNARFVEQLQNENRELKNQLEASPSIPEMVGGAAAMQKIFDTIRTVAGSSASVLIEGESGTGKELVARALHKYSPRRSKNFIPIFCGGLSENLLESELFGHIKGAFTGATMDKPGLFEEANGGTLFLDEIADINMNVQTKLLRVLQEGEIKRVGANKITKVDVRIIAATNKNLWDEVQAGNFREDLYYRLNVINLRLPPLRERQVDIPLLANHFLNLYCMKNKKNIHTISKQAMDTLIRYHWPGNVRELENAIERAVVLCGGAVLEEEHFSLQQAEAQLPIGSSLEEINKFAILKTMELTNNNKTKAAQILGVSRRWLQYKLKEWNGCHAD